MVQPYLHCTVSKEIPPRSYGTAEPCVRRLDRIYSVDGLTANLRGRHRDGYDMRQMHRQIGRGAVMLDTYKFAKRLITLKRLTRFDTVCIILTKESYPARFGAMCRSSKASSREK